MADGASGPITQLLNAASGGDGDAAAELLPLIYGELHRIAQARMAALRPGSTLQPTALIHEAYLRLLGDDKPGWNSRGHFFGAAAQAMRQILVDAARRKASLKRGGDRKRLDLDDVEPAVAAPSVNILALDEALQRLERDDPRKARIVMLRFFAGLTTEETAAALDVSVPTIEREWRFTRTLLHMQIADDEARTCGGSMNDR
ncbi:MAG: sigma-70 family RNA polymerase sigma factor [Planctomycetota bacterium]|jgi:RNA polymerase sigma factor (TIGR02999 family)